MGSKNKKEYPNLATRIGCVPHYTDASMYIVLPQNWNLASFGNREDKGRHVKGITHELYLKE